MSQDKTRASICNCERRDPWKNCCEVVRLRDVLWETSRERDQLSSQIVDLLAEVAQHKAWSSVFHVEELEAKVKSLEQAVLAERESCAKLAENPYSDEVQVIGPEEPFATGRKIAKAIRARGGV